MTKEQKIELLGDILDFDTVLVVGCGCEGGATSAIIESVPLTSVFAGITGLIVDVIIKAEVLDEAEAIIMGMVSCVSDMLADEVRKTEADSSEVH